MPIKKPKTYYINPRSLVSYNEVCEILCTSKIAISKLLKQGKFPKPIIRDKYNAVGTGGNMRRKYWIFQDIMDYIDNLKEEKEQVEYKQKAITRRTWREYWKGTAVKVVEIE